MEVFGLYQLMLNWPNSGFSLIVVINLFKNFRRHCRVQGAAVVAPLPPAPTEVPAPSVRKNQMTNLVSGSIAKTVLAGFMLLALPFLITYLTLSLPLTTYFIYARNVSNLQNQNSHLPPIWKICRLKSNNK